MDAGVKEEFLAHGKKGSGQSTAPCHAERGTVLQTGYRQSITHTHHGVKTGQILFERV
jgi:hypothetical protein